MIFGYNKISYPGYGGKTDIKLTLHDYFDLIDNLKQDKLSDLTIMKFKNLMCCNFNRLIAMFIENLIPSYFLTKIIMGPVNRGHGGYALFFPTFIMFYLGFGWWGVHRTTHRRLYTELLTDPGEDGVYIRRVLRSQKPALWSFISHQMYNNGYKLDEMNEFSTKEFPTAPIEK